MKKIWENLREKQALSNLLVVLSGIAFYMLLKNLPDVKKFFGDALAILSPIIWGAAIAYLLNPFYMFLKEKLFGNMKNRKTAHVLSVIIAFTVAIAILSLILITLIPQLISSITLFLGNLENYFEGFKQTLIRLQAHFNLNIDVEALIGSWSQTFSTASDWVLNNIDGILGASMKVGNSVFNFFLCVLFAIYILSDKDSIMRAFKRLNVSIFSEKTYTRLTDIAHRSDKIFAGYIGGSLLDSLVIGVANFLFIIIMNMPYALLISVIIALTNLIPTFGPIIGAIPSALILLIINPWYALWFLIFTIIIQALDGNLIKPLLLRDSMGLSLIWILAAIIIGGRLFGILGMLLGIPVFAILANLIEEGVSARLAKKGYDENADKKSSD